MNGVLELAKVVKKIPECEDLLGAPSTLSRDRGGVCDGRPGDGRCQDDGAMGLPLVSPGCVPGAVLGTAT